MEIAEVLFDLSIDRGFDYFVPPLLSGQVRPGMRVRVSLNKSERVGYVVRMKGESPFKSIKPIIAVENEREQIPALLIELGNWIADYYCCPREHTLRILLPSVVRSGEMTHKQVLYLTLGAKSLEDPHCVGLTPRQKEIIQFLRQTGTLPQRELIEQTGVTASVIDKLVEKGWVVKENRVVERTPFLDDFVLPDEPKKLTAQQAKALSEIVASVEARDAQVILLHGVTASGKTEVYLQAIARCLELGLEAIVLVPEISLTPQTCDRFRQRFGNLVSVLHSGLSNGERFDEWTRINEGRSRIAVGARSALFAPFRHLGLIVVDEEHENTYKQDESPRYNARDIAVVRGKLEKATVLLGSATPSLESYYNCERGRYKLVEMTQRIDGSRLPTIELVDMAQESTKTGQGQLFSTRLTEKIMDRLYKGEQVILFLNRRGYATQMICPQCGYVSTCSNCSVAHTYHRNAQLLVCHLCGEQKIAPTTCPQCGSDAIKYTGIGTEKIEALTMKAFPMAKVARMDSDTMTTKDSYRRVLDLFRAGRINILIGTQMIAKGLDFPNVTLVGVLQADSGLHIPDFRSGERTFQLITQVAGRAGRGDIDGLVIVQTYTPQHFVLQYAMRQDYKAFYKEEIVSRKELDFPPVSHMVMIHFRSTDESAAQAASEEFAAKITPLLEKQVQVIGPMPAPLSRVKSFYRYQLLLRGGNIRVLTRLVRSLIVGVTPPKSVEIYADVDPRMLS